MSTSAEIESLLRRHRSALLRRLAALVGCRAAAEDLTQEACIRLLGAMAQGAVQHPPALLFRIARNLAIDHVRVERCRARLLPPEPDPRAAVSVADPCPDPARTCEARERLAHLLARLSPRQRRAVEICRVDGRTYAEAARELGVSASTVQKDLTAALGSRQPIPGQPEAAPVTRSPPAIRLHSDNCE